MFGLPALSPRGRRAAGAADPVECRDRCVAMNGWRGACGLVQNPSYCGSSASARPGAAQTSQSHQIAAATAHPAPWMALVGHGRCRRRCCPTHRPLLRRSRRADGGFEMSLRAPEGCPLGRSVHLVRGTPAQFAAILPGEGVAEVVLTSGINSFLQLYNAALITRLILTWCAGARAPGRGRATAQLAAAALTMWL